MKFTSITTAQVERVYIVEAEDAAQARRRLRIFLQDPELLRDGLVTPPAVVQNVTAERIKSTELGKTTED